MYWLDVLEYTLSEGDEFGGVLTHHSNLIAIDILESVMTVPVPRGENPVVWNRYSFEVADNGTSI